ncbi:MAG: archaeosine biosynthesis radical SAM protein RaSEA [Halodesulfurarchaeum sp.]
MSRPSPEQYERGRGMDAHNQVMRDLRANREETYDPTEPTRVWLDEDLTPAGRYRSLTIILNTGGCRWARAGGCTMCGYVAESVEDGTVSHPALMNQVEEALDYERRNTEERAGMVKLYTSGSVLDEREIGPETREAIAERFADRDRIVVESLPNFVTEDRISDFTDAGLAVDVAIGLETANDRVRRDAVNKYFDFEDFVDAAETAGAAGAGVKAYLLLKPPFLAEREAIEDMVRSIERVGPYAHTVSMNPTNVQRYTLVDDLHFEEGYRPPWLWSVVEVLQRTTDEDPIVVSDPVGKGSDRGPHNCGECDERVARAISDFSLRQDPSVFEEVSCSCVGTWEAVKDRERAYNLPLAQ